MLPYLLFSTSSYQNELYLTAFYQTQPDTYLLFNQAIKADQQIKMATTVYLITGANRGMVSIESS